MTMPPTERSSAPIIQIFKAATLTEGKGPDISVSIQVLSEEVRTHIEMNIICSLDVQCHEIAIPTSDTFIIGTIQCRLVHHTLNGINPTKFLISRKFSPERIVNLVLQFTYILINSTDHSFRVCSPLRSCRTARALSRFASTGTATVKHAMNMKAEARI